VGCHNVRSACHQCSNCTRGIDNMCTKSIIWGKRERKENKRLNYKIADYLAFGNGGFAEYTRMQACFVYPLPDTLPNEYLPLLSPSPSSVPSLFPSLQINNKFERAIGMQHPWCVPVRLCGLRSPSLAFKQGTEWRFWVLVVWYVSPLLPPFVAFARIWKRGEKERLFICVIILHSFYLFAVQGHLGIKFARAMGCEVGAISTTKSKEKEAKELGKLNIFITRKILWLTFSVLGAHHFIVSSDEADLKKYQDYFDFIIVTATKEIDYAVSFFFFPLLYLPVFNSWPPIWQPLMGMLRAPGTLVIPGIPGESIKLNSIALCFKGNEKKKIIFICAMRNYE
jgi:threonine dehydrogenase-like Zn-dependent dehydrogenase